MAKTLSIGIIGDYQATNHTHQMTDAALKHSAEHLHAEIQISWLPTTKIDAAPETFLQEFDAFWCAPGSPYQSFSGALKAIRFAREQNRPFIGTCGGFQHAVIEYARNVMGFKDAQHAESDPNASNLFITPLKCSLVGKTMAITLQSGSNVQNIYQENEVTEHYYCNFGLNPQYQTVLHEAGLRVVGIDEDQEARILEQPEHPFFVATLFLPQSNSTPDHPHPLILAYLRAGMLFHSETWSVDGLRRSALTLPSVP